MQAGSWRSIWFIPSSIYAWEKNRTPLAAVEVLPVSEENHRRQINRQFSLLCPPMTLKAGTNGVTHDL